MNKDKPILKSRYLFTFLLFFLFCFHLAADAAIVVDMQLNNGGFVSYDHFSAYLFINNDQPLDNAQIYGILEIAGVFYYWPSFSTDIEYQLKDIEAGGASLRILEFDFPDIDSMIPFGPMNFWGACYMDIDHYGYDVQEFWLDNEHKWTPVPTPTSTPAPPTPAGFVYIAPGTFTMGSPSDEACRIDDETQYAVTLTHGFYMMEREVTRQMWADLKAVQPMLPTDPSNTTYSPAMDHPVQQSTWYESVLFANLMSVQYGYTWCYYKDAEFAIPVDWTNYTSGSFYCNFNANGFRLPTESEWEYACRAGTTGPFSCSEPNYNSGNCSSCTSGTHPVLEQYCVFCANGTSGTAVAGSKVSNPGGLYDMHGNVWEWCWDWYGAYPSGSQVDPTGETSGSNRVFRGGSWVAGAKYCRSAIRSGDDPGYREYSIGFRLMRVNL